jgi:hypothetical protein
MKNKKDTLINSYLNGRDRLSFPPADRHFDHPSVGVRGIPGAERGISPRGARPRSSVGAVTAVGALGRVRRLKAVPAH